MNHKMITTAVAIAALCATAATDCTTWHRLKTNGAKGFTASCWYAYDDPSQTTFTAASDPSGQYYVPEGLRIDAEAVTFPGNALAVAGTLRLTGKSVATVVGDLRLLPGAQITFNNNCTLQGVTTVEGTESAPVTMAPFYFTGRTFTFGSAFKGEPGCLLRVASTGKFAGTDGSFATRAQFSTTPLLFSGDWSGYLGTFAVCTNSYVVFNPSTSAMAGRISVESGGVLSSTKTGALTVGDLSLANGAELAFPSATTMAVPYHWLVTNALEVADRLQVSFARPSMNGFIVARLSGPAAANAPDVSGLEVSVALTFNGTIPLPRNSHAEYVDNGDGTKDLKISWDTINVMTTQNSGQPSEKSAFAAGNEAYWQSGTIPDPTAESVDVYASQNIMFWLYGTLRYDGMTLVMNSGKTLYNQAYNLYLKEVHLLGDSLIIGPNAGNNYDHTLHTDLVLHGGTAKLTDSWGSKWFALKGTIRGAGAMAITHAATYGNRLRSDDSGFTGDYVLTGPTGEAVYDRPVFYIDVGDDFVFGGTYSGSAAWKSVTFSSFPYVLFSSDMTMAEPTRGVHVLGGAVFEVPAGKTLDISEPVTYAGEVVKLGAGALVLGGSALFIDGKAATEPLAGTNVLTVAEGTLRVAATNAVDGLEVTFAEGTSLEVDLAATGDLAEFGAVNTKWSAPFASGAADGKIAVSLPVRPLPDGQTSVAICTVTATAAENLEFALPGSVSRRKCTIDRRTNADGTVTFLAVVSAKPGLLISFK